MPRQPRIYSNASMYHVMIRGINGEKIFIKSFYKSKVLRDIKEIGEELRFNVIGFCVMDNHMHLLVKAGEEELITLMKRLNIKYAMFYNKLENRYGHVFQDRYKSEAIEDDRYYLGVLRYIHNNPVRAGISQNILNYKWSSANEYVNQKSDIIEECYLAEMLKLFRNMDAFLKFHDDFDYNVYVDNKEDEKDNIQMIINKIINDFVNKYKIEDEKKINKEQKSELAEILLKRNICTIKEIADLCRMSTKDIISIKNEIDLA